MVGYNKGVERADAVVRELAGSGHKAMRLPLEDTAQIRKVAAAVREQYGRADVLVNSAGFTRMVPHHDLEALDDDLIDQVLTANVRGPFATIRAFAPLLQGIGRRRHRQHLVRRGGARHRQLDHLRRLESGAQHDEHGAGAGARPRDPRRRRRAGHGAYRISCRAAPRR